MLPHINTGPAILDRARQYKRKEYLLCKQEVNPAPWIIHCNGIPALYVSHCPFLSFRELLEADFRMDLRNSSEDPNNPNLTSSPFLQSPPSPSNDKRRKVGTWPHHDVLRP